MRSLFLSSRAFGPSRSRFYATTGSAFGRKNVTDIEYNGTNLCRHGDGRKGEHLRSPPRTTPTSRSGVNLNYFTDEMKAAYTTLKENEARKVQSQLLNQSKLGDGRRRCPTRAHRKARSPMPYTGTYINPYTGEKVDAVKDEEAPFIAIGVPVTYKPFNFYKVTRRTRTRSKAATRWRTSVETYTEGKGYTIVMPGIPRRDVCDHRGYRGLRETPSTKRLHTTPTPVTSFSHWTEYSALKLGLRLYAQLLRMVGSQGRLHLRQEHGTTTMRHGKNGNGGRMDERRAIRMSTAASSNEQGSFGVNGYVNPWAYSNDASLHRSDQLQVPERETRRYRHRQQGRRRMGMDERDQRERHHVLYRQRDRRSGKDQPRRHDPYGEEPVRYQQ